MPGNLAQMCSVPGPGQYVTYNVEDCYRRCSEYFQCISFEYDPFTRQCTLFDKTLQDQGFVPSQDKTKVYYNLRGCFHCNSPPPPSRPRCPEDGLGQDPKPGYICDKQGVLADNSSVAVILYPGNREECYELCRQFDSVGQCESYAWTNGYYETSKCLLFNTSIRAKGFTPSKHSGFYATNLRGCYTCDNQTTPDPIPSPQCPPLEFSNGDFSQVVTEPQTNRQLPKYWNYSGNITSVKSSNNNTSAQVYQLDLCMKQY